MEAPETQGKRTVFKILVSSCVFLCAESQNMQLYLTCSFQGNGREDLCRLKHRQKKYERGARIADRRKALGLTQDELAHRIGIGRQLLSAIENGGSFRVQTLDSLAVELEVSADFIMYGAGSTKAELIAEAVKVLSDMDEMQLRQCVAMMKAMMSV